MLTYSSLLPNVHDIVYKHLHVVYQSERMDKVFEKPPIVAYRRDKNLCDVLLHGKTNKIVNRIPSSCQDECNYCARLMRTDIKDTLSLTTHRPEIKVNCRLQNVVYAISSSRCDVVVYVGETEWQDQDRMKEHLRAVRLRKDKPILAHYGDNHDERDLQFSILEKLYKANHTERLLQEAVWIK